MTRQGIKTLVIPRLEWIGIVPPEIRFLEKIGFLSPSESLTRHGIRIVDWQLLSADW